MGEVVSPVMQCVECCSPWIDREFFPVIFNTLETLPVGWCDCDVPELESYEYSRNDYIEVYYLATNPASCVDGKLSLSIQPTVLIDVEWFLMDEDDLYITEKGRKLMPLLLVVAADLLDL